MSIFRRFWNRLFGRKPKQPTIPDDWNPENDPMYREVVMRAFRSGKIVVGNRDANGVTFTEHEIKPHG